MSIIIAVSIGKEEEKMTTMENTISMMKDLSEADLLKTQNFTKKLFQRHESETMDEAMNKFLMPKSREDIYRDLEISRQQAAEGKCIEMGQALAEIRKKYGI